MEEVDLERLKYDRGYYRALVAQGVRIQWERDRVLCVLDRDGRMLARIHVSYPKPKGAEEGCLRW